LLLQCQTGLVPANQAAAAAAARFNLTLGERLIEHLKNWLDPDTLLQAGPFQWKSGAASAVENLSITAGLFLRQQRK
jgi:hypothetical protein